MKTNSIVLKAALVISAFGLFAALPAMAQAPPALRLTDGTNTVTVDANNNATYSPSSFATACAAAGCSSSVTAGSVTWAGNIGGFVVTNAQGNAQNGAFTNPDLAVSASYTGGGNGTLTVSWSAVGFIAPAPGSVIAQVYPQTGATGGSVTYSYYIDNTNALFGTGELLGSLSGLVSTIIGPVWPTLAAGTYSATEVEAITLSSGGVFGGDNAFYLTTETLMVSCAVSGGKVGTAYNSSIGATGGTPSYTYSIVAGALAPGLILNASTGAVTGTPTTAGSYSYTVQAVDSTGAPAISNCGQNIALGGGGGQNPGLACPSTTGLTQGVYYSSSFAGANLTAPDTFKISAGSLPAGLRLNASTGAVYGTPSGTGAFSFTGSVTDSEVPPVTVTSGACTGTIAPKPTPISLACAASTKGVVGTAYTSAVVASGGTPPYVSYTLVSGSLPPGLKLNTSTGAITGTPTTAGTYSYTVQVIDTNGAKASDGSGSGRCKSSGCSITITSPAPISVKCPTSTGTVGAAYSSGAVASGGTAPYTYSVSAGSLPAGLILNASTGAITGTPTTPGSDSFTVSVQDSTGKISSYHTCSGGCGITVAPAITVSCPGGTAVTGTAYSSTPTVTGGTAPYTFSISSGSLPSGLSINPTTGAITGSPKAAGTYSFTIQVVDKKGLIGFSSCTSCSTGICGAGWGGSTQPSQCSITVSAPSGNSQGGGGDCNTNNNGSGNNWGGGW